MNTSLMAATLLAAATLSGFSPAQAAVTTTAVSGGVTIDFAAFDGLVNTGGQVDLGQGVSFAAATDAELGPAARDLGDNGLWTFGLGGFAAAGSDGVMRFTFAGLKSGVSAFVSHQGGGTLRVEALGVGGTVLESTTLSFAAPSGLYGYDEGTTIGFVRGAADIQALRLTGVGAVADNVSAVPEPGTWLMLAGGLAAVAGLARRRAG